MYENQRRGHHPDHPLHRSFHADHNHGLEIAAQRSSSGTQLPSVTPRYTTPAQQTQLWQQHARQEPILREKTESLVEWCKIKSWILLFLRIQTLANVCHRLSVNKPKETIEFDPLFLLNPTVVGTEWFPASYPQPMTPHFPVGCKSPPKARGAHRSGSEPRLRSACCKPRHRAAPALSPRLG